MEEVTSEVSGYCVVPFLNLLNLDLLCRRTQSPANARSEATKAFPAQDKQLEHAPSSGGEERA